MPDSLKKAVVLAVTIVFLLCGCGSVGIYNVSIATEEQETDYSSVYAETIEFGGLKNKEYQSELNEELAEQVRTAIGEFDLKAQEIAGELPQGIKPAINIRQNVKRSGGGIISLITEYYTYQGGAHGSTVWQPYNAYIDDEEPHNLALKELFVSEDYIDTLNRLIDELIAAKPEQYSGLWAEPHITADRQDNFYLTNEDLVIWFPPYELSYYAKGFIEFPIRLTELSGILKDEFKTEEGE